MNKRTRRCQAKSEDKDRGKSEKADGGRGTVGKSVRKKLRFTVWVKAVANEELTKEKEGRAKKTKPPRRAG